VFELSRFENEVVIRVQIIGDVYLEKSLLDGAIPFAALIVLLGR
jgi:hypothetical protein